MKRLKVVTAALRRVVAMTKDKCADEPVRVRVYGLAVAVGVLLVGYEQITQDEMNLWLEVVAAALAVICATETARRKVKPKDDETL